MFKKIYDAILLYAPYVMGIMIITAMTLGAFGLVMVAGNWVLKLLGV